MNYKRYNEHDTDIRGPLWFVSPHKKRDSVTLINYKLLIKTRGTTEYSSQRGWDK